MLSKKRFIDRSVEGIVNLLRSICDKYNFVNSILSRSDFTFVLDSMDSFYQISESASVMRRWKSGLKGFIQKELDEKKFSIRPNGLLSRILFSCKMENCRAKKKESVIVFRNDFSNRLVSVFKSLPTEDIESVGIVCDFMKQNGGVTFLKNNIPNVFCKFQDDYHEMLETKKTYEKIFEGSIMREKQWMNLKDMSDLKKFFNFKRNEVRRNYSNLRNMFVDEQDEGMVVLFVDLLNHLGESQVGNSNHQPRKRTNSESLKKRMKKEKNDFYGNLKSFDHFMKMAPSQMKKFKEGYPKYLKPPIKQTKKCMKKFEKQSKVFKNQIFKSFGALESIDKKRRLFYELKPVANQISLILRSRRRLLEEMEHLDVFLSGFLKKMSMLDEQIKKMIETKNKIKKIEEDYIELEKSIQSKNL